jgi:hypothetical protein
LSGEPGEKGLRVIESLRDPSGFSGLSEELAISPHCGPRKLGIIKNHWQARVSWARGENYTFRLLNETSDGDLAGVLIGATSEKNPFGAEVISLALIREEGNWKVAPLEGSFENTGLGFDEAVNERARTLERWMARERIGAAAHLETEERQRMADLMKKAVPAKELQELGAREVLDRFLTAVGERNADAAIVWQGFLEMEEFPEVDWEEQIRTTRLGLKGEDEQNIWRLLTSRKVMRVVMTDEDETEHDSCEYLVGFLSPFQTGARNTNLTPVRFQVARTGSGWRVQLPVVFAHADEGRNAFINMWRRAVEWEDHQTVTEMFEVFEAENEKIREKELESVVEGLKKDLATGDLDTFLRRHYRYVEEQKEEADDEEEDDDIELPRARIQFGPRGNEEDQKRQEIYETAVRWWNDALEDRESVAAETSKIFLREEIGLALVSLPPSSETWKPRYLEVWLGQDEEGWMILPGQGKPLAGSHPESQEKAITGLVEECAKFRETVYEEFLKKTPEVVALDDGEGEVASEEEAYQVVKAWRETARDKGMMALLKASAVRARPEDPKPLLKTLGFVRQSAADASEPDRILGSRAAGRYRGVSLMTDRGQGNEMRCPLVLVVPTSEGFRVLADIELPLATNGGISILNEERLEDLSQAMPEEDFAKITELHEWHQKVAKPVWEKWKREQEALEN